METVVYIPRYIFFQNKMGDDNILRLQWDQFEKNISGVIKTLRTDDQFFDCTIICEGARVRGHRYMKKFSSFTSFYFDDNSA